jgi:hypothetical protein
MPAHERGESPFAHEVFACFERGTTQQSRADIRGSFPQPAWKDDRSGSPHTDKHMLRPE